MKKLLVLCLICLLTSPLYANLIWNWNSYNGHEYALTNNYNNWAGAEQEAILAGGHLVTINDAAENEWLSETFYNTYSPAGPGNPSYNAAWIGLHNVSGSWLWVDGDPSAYRAPNSGGRSSDSPGMYLHCDSHYLRETWNFNGVHNTNPSYYFNGIIEIPEPATLLLLGLGGLALRIRK